MEQRALIVDPGHPGELLKRDGEGQVEIDHHGRPGFSEDASLMSKN
jgi:hypothetical protein